MTIRIEQGWDTANAGRVAQLYEEAFGAKFSRAIPQQDKRIAVLAEGFCPLYSFVAYDDDKHDNKIVGLAGFNVGTGSLTGGIGAKDLFNRLGFFAGCWACVVFSLFERDPDEGELVMDGIAVDRDYRGQGIGIQLLDEVARYARENGFDAVRLDVIDSNPRARKLYEAKGFEPQKTESFPFLKWLIGFSGATTMTLDVKPKS